jgi:hypothetical protein
MDEAAKARAEAAAARRAKILARQKDRITSITGAYLGEHRCISTLVEAA